MPGTFKKIKINLKDDELIIIKNKMTEMGVTITSIYNKVKSPDTPKGIPKSYSGWSSRLGGNYSLSPIECKFIYELLQGEKDDSLSFLRNYASEPGIADLSTRLESANESALKLSTDTRYSEYVSIFKEVFHKTSLGKKNQLLDDVYSLLKKYISQDKKPDI